MIGKKEEQAGETNQEKHMRQDWDSSGEGKGRLRLDWTGRQLGWQPGKRSLREEKLKYLSYCCLGAASSTMRQLEGHHLWGS